MRQEPLSKSEEGQACNCGPQVGEIPVGLLSLFIEDSEVNPPLLALTVGYESGSWRAQALARHLVEWVLDFALRRKEREGLSPGLAVEMVRQAIRRTFGNGHDRGAPGEILLHLALRQFFGSDTVINKVYFKTANNDTYKGFDAVHVVHGDEGLELWLGEAKFYTDLSKAIRSAVEELDKHLDADYLKAEFALVGEKIEDDHPHASELRRLLHPNTSLDDVFRRVCVPVLLTYDSSATRTHVEVCSEYRQELEAEIRPGWVSFRNRMDGHISVAIRLILVPLATKAALMQALDRAISWS